MRRKEKRARPINFKFVEFYYFYARANRFIIGTEKICYASKELLLENKKRLSVETFEDIFHFHFYAQA